MSGAPASLYDHILVCNRRRPADFVPFVLDDKRYGSALRTVAARLAKDSSIFEFAGERLTLSPDAPADWSAQSELMDAALKPLCDTDGAAPWRGEYFDIRDGLDGPIRLRLERSTLPLMGIPGYGVHLNGLVADGDNPADWKMWIGLRSENVRLFPNTLDNIVAGGISAGHGPFDTLIKEAEEEAGMPEALVRQAVPVGAVAYKTAINGGLRDEALYLYDLFLPADFTPVGQDGETQSFELLPVLEVLEQLRSGYAYKFNIPLVLIDFFVRQGLITPDEPRYLDLVAGLNGIPDQVLPDPFPDVPIP